MKRAIVLLLLIIICAAGFLAVKGAFPFIPISDSSIAPSSASSNPPAIKSIAPENIKVGDIITYNVPATAQQYYNYPPVVSHRVIEIKTAPSLGFRTKGDNAGEDPYIVNPADIRDITSKQAPYIGFLISFFLNQHGLNIVIAVLALLAIVMYNREILHGMLKIRQLIPVKTSHEEKRHDQGPAQIKEDKGKKEIIAKLVQPQPKKAILLKIDRKHGELPDEALAAEKEIFSALDRLQNKQEKPKNQE
jgi:signal peptidase I